MDVSSAWLQPGVTWGAGTRVVVRSDQVRYRQSLLSDTHTDGSDARARQQVGRSLATPTGTGGYITVVRYSNQGSEHFSV